MTRDELNQSIELLDYDEWPGLRSSSISTYIDKPIYWYHTEVLCDWPKEQASKEMGFGTAVHKMIELGGWEYMGIREIPRKVLNADGHCKGKAWTEWKEANPADTYIKPGEINTLRVIWEHLQANTWCREIIDLSSKEVKHLWEDNDFGLCKVKMDAVCPQILVDWKTTSCRTRARFANEIVERAYDVRMAFYRRAFKDKYGHSPVVYLLAIRNSGGFEVASWQLTDAWLDDADARLIFTVDEMKRFDLAEYLNRPPELLTQPRWSQTDLEAVA